MRKQKVFLGFLLFLFLMVVFPNFAQAIECVPGTNFQISTTSGNTAVIGFYKNLDRNGNPTNYVGVSKKMYSANGGSSAVFCVDPNLNGPGNKTYCRTTALSGDVKNAVIQLYNEYKNILGGRNFNQLELGAKEEVFRQINAALRLVYEHYGMVKGTEAYPAGTQYGYKSYGAIYGYTKNIIDKMRKENPGYNYWGNLDTVLAAYSDTAKSLGLKQNQYIVGYNSADGKGTMRNVLARYNAALQAVESGTTLYSASNINVALQGEATITQEGDSYVAKTKIAISGMPDVSKGTITNIKIASNNSMGTISFDNPNIATTVLNQTATSTYLDITITIPKSSVARLKELNYSFNLSFTFNNKNNYDTTVYEACVTTDGGYNCSGSEIRQRMIVFEQNVKEVPEDKSYPLTINIPFENKSCDKYEDKVPKEYYDPYGNLIDKGSDEENLKEWNNVCGNKVCYESPELTPSQENITSGTFNELLFEAFGCCEDFNPTEHAEYQDFYDSFCKPKTCYEGDLDPNSDTFDADKFKTECCSMTPPAGYEDDYNILCPPDSCYIAPELDPRNPAFNVNRFKNECCSLPRPSDTTLSGYYDRYCPSPDPCKPVINAPTWCTTSQTVTIKESDDFERCIWNKKDPAGNDYNLNQQGLTNNPYCRVACKEDYTINLPSLVPSVRAGQYFVLTTQVQGTRTCKSTDINQAQFDRDVKSLSQKVVNAYNAWSKANAYEKATLESSTEYKIAGQAFNTKTEAKTYMNNNYSVDKWNNTHADNKATRSYWSGDTYTLYDGTEEIQKWTIESEPLKEVGTYYATSACRIERPEEGDPFYVLKDPPPDMETCSVDQKHAVIPSYKTYSLNTNTMQITESTHTPMDPGILGYLSTEHCYDNEKGIGSCPKTFASDHWSEIKKTELYNGSYTSLADYKNALDKAIEDLNNAFNYINACAEWNNDYNFDPLIKYDYDENYYMNNVIKDNNQFVVQGEKQLEENKQYCVNSSCTNSNISTRTVSFISCSINGSTSSCTTKTKQVHNNTKVSQTKTYAATYKPKMTFYTKLPEGIVKGYTNGNKPSASDYAKLGQVFPVALTTKKGTYTYTLNYSNIGQYNDTESDNLGRFTGGNSGRPNIYEKVGYDNTYYCKYNVHEDICIDCCTEPDCDPKLVYFYRPISLYDVFPNSKNDFSPRPDYLNENVTRLVGKNWTSVKGKFTQEKIERENAEAYGEAEYSFTLTPANMMKIREYNKNHQYNDFNLVCSEGIDCTSNFLRDGKENGYFKEAELNNLFIHANDVEHDSPRGLTICPVGANNNSSCVGPSWK